MQRWLHYGVILASLLAAAGCAEPDLGDAPFFCNSGTPECPEGYSCVNKVCRRAGYTPPAGDAGRADSGPSKDDRGTITFDKGPGKLDKGPGKLDKGPGKLDKGPPPKDTKPWPDKTPPTPVKIYITEFMPNPDAVYDSAGEWFELYNPSANPVNINGWTLKDKGVDLHVMAHTGPLMVPAKGYLVLGVSKNMSQNGGVKVAYAYSKFLLSNSDDEVILIDNNGKTIDSFTYALSKGFNIPKGASLSVKYPNANKNLASSWCVETKPWNGSKGDKGSPGTNPGCK